MHSPERKLGFDDKQLTHPASSQAASRGIDVYFERPNQPDTDAGDDALTATLVLADVASPHSIKDVAAAVQAQSSTASTVQNHAASSDHDLDGEHNGEHTTAHPLIPFVSSPA